MEAKGGPVPTPNTRYHRYSSFLEKYRYLREISAVSIPFDTVHVTAYLIFEGCFTAKKQYVFVCVCAVALNLKEVLYHRIKVQTLLLGLCLLFNTYEP